MPQQNKTVRITLSENRLKDLKMVLRKDDRVVARVEKRLDKGKYLAEIQGVKIVAYFNGLLHKGDEIYAVVQSLAPNILLKMRRLFSILL